MLRVVAQSLKPVKLFSQQLPTFLLFRDRRSVVNNTGSVCTVLPTLLGPRTRITHGLQRLMGCILPTMQCRSQHFWELLHPFAHHCQHARNNFQHCWGNNAGSCYVRLHATSSSETQGQIVGARERLNGRKKMARRKVKNGEKSSFRFLLFFAPFFPPV